VIYALIFREVFVSKDSAKVDLVYSRFLKTIYKKNKEESNKTGDNKEGDYC
jgi:hypothetical protein